ncbi:BatD family protein [Cellvibrio sp. UBA7661]|uniref:BatD family protein n=1 Tax=Cellvibrio sp. UBA7661 TaxID=1946311 RepID=UPI002F351F87
MKNAFFTLQKLLSHCIGFLLMVTGLNVYAGNLTASVDRDTLALTETFTLTLRYDEQINATPDYELLQKDFDILNTRSGTQMSIINGSMEASTEWKIALAPKRIGKLLIPSFSIDGAISDAIEITIEGKSKSPQNTDDNVSVEIETSKDTSYVQEQIIVTLRLFTTISLSGMELSPLQVKDALAVQLDEKQYQTKINGRPGAVIETRYALFPQQSGELIIPSMLYQVAIDTGHRDLWDRFYGNNQNNILRLRTEEQRLTILPAPAAANGNNWMPATNVSLSEHWSTSIDALKIGEPVTRSITIKADGLTAGQINPLQILPVNGLTFYNDQAQNDDQKNSQGITGSRIETIAIVPTKAGDFTLPEVKVNWWDTNSNSLRTATLPAVTLRVGLGDMSAQQLAEQNQQATTENEETAPATVDIDTDLTGLKEQSTRIVQQTPIWLYITNLVSLLAAAYFALEFFIVKRKLAGLHTAKEQEKNQRLQAENAAWNQVKRELAENNWKELRKALIDWAQIYWKNPSLTNLQTIATHINSVELTEELRKLDEAIFGGNNITPDSEILLQTLANFRRNKSYNNKNSSPLQPLYKS